MSYKVQIDGTIRDATPDEAARIDEIANETQTRLAAMAEQAANKIAAKNKLKNLGLTEAEIAALVG